MNQTVFAVCIFACLTCQVLSILSPLPANKKCRGELDCTDPEECIDYYCRQTVQCRWPGLPYYGNLSPDKRAYDIGETVAFSCQDGYQMFGVKGATCLYNGNWSNGKPRCVAMGCFHPGRPFRGLLEPDKEFYELGEQVTYSCKGLYQLGGNPVARCREDGTWTDPRPVCYKPPLN